MANNLYKIINACYDSNGSLLTTPSNTEELFNAVYEPDGTGKGRLRINLSGSTGGGSCSACTLEELSDVTIVGGTNGQLLGYDGTGWINVDPTTGAFPLSGLTDATITNIQVDQIIKWDGTAWVNVDIDTLATDSYVTNFTINSATNTLSITQNGNGSNFNVDLGYLVDTDSYVCGGTYDTNSGIVTFTTNSGYSFQVSGFTTGMTDTYVVDGSLTGDILTLVRSDGSNANPIDLSALNENYWTSGSGADSLISKTNETHLGEASGDFSVSFGNNARATGNNSTASGYRTWASGDYANANGFQTTASGYYSTASGYGTTATGSGAIATGSFTTASGAYSTSSGYYTTASGYYSYAGGQGNSTYNLLADGVNSFNYSKQESSTVQYGAHGDNSAILGGTDNDVSSLNGVIIGGMKNTISVAADNSVILGGNNLNATQSETVYVKNLNINSVPSGTSVKNLGVDVNGYVVESTGGGSGQDLYWTSGSTGTHSIRTIGSLISGGDATGDFSIAEGQSTTASGYGSRAEGNSTTASNYYSHAEGRYTLASGIASHAEGDSTTASGKYSHSNGSKTESAGLNSYAGGMGNTSYKLLANGTGSFNHSRQDSTSIQYGAFGDFSAILGGTDNKTDDQSINSVVIGGENNYASADNAVVIGGSGLTATVANTVYVQKFNIKEIGSTSPINNLGIDSNGNVVGGVVQALYWTSGSTGTDSITSIPNKNNGGDATGNFSLSFGYNTTARGDYSTASGYYTTASGYYSHAEGYSTSSDGDSSHTEGNRTNARGANSHAEGNSTTANADDSHAEGRDTQANGKYSHAEGWGNTASGIGSHVEGGVYDNEGNPASSPNQATSYSAHAEGRNTLASSTNSHAEGQGTIASGSNSHAEGAGTTAQGQSSHSEGRNTQSNGISSHVEGYNSQSVGLNSHAEGESTVADGTNTHSEGYFTQASQLNSHSEGEYTHSNGRNTHVSGQGNNTYKLLANGENSFNHSKQESTTTQYGTYGDNSAILGGVDNKTETSATNSVVLGGSGLIATEANRVYVDKFNIKTLSGGTSVNNLGIDADGNIMIGSAGSSSNMSVMTTTSDYTILDTDDLIRTDSTSNNIDLTLPQLTSGLDGKKYIIKTKNKTNAVRIATNASDTFDDGSTSYKFVAALESITLVGDFNSTQWVRID